MNKLLSTDEIRQVASEFGLPANFVKMIIMVESSGTGFDPKTELIKLQFEPLFFKKYTRTKVLNGVDNQAEEWKAFNVAYAINKDAALKSTSWGLGQIMGFNHKAAGYDTVDKMVSDFKVGEYYQLRGMLKFISSNRAMFNALRSKDWALFAKLYNGPNYKTNNYDTKLAAAFNKLNPNGSIA